MNPTHAGIIRHLRRLAIERQSSAREMMTDLTDEQIARLMFKSYRISGAGSRGLRLTESGLDIMVGHFRHYEIILGGGRSLQANELIYLDRNATLPYYFSRQKIVMFETVLGMKMALCDGDVLQLCEIEGL